MTEGVVLRAARRVFRSEAEEVVAVDDVTLTVTPGEFVCLYGHSGSGKTTLLNLIAGLDVVTSGAVEVVGRDPSTQSDESRIALRREVVGMVHQTDFLIEEFTAAENVALPLEANGMATCDALERAAELLAAVGLAGLDRRLPRHLSGGQRQRVGIARALSGGRRILLADEPTGSLDTKNALAIFGLMRSLSDQGILVIIASHDPRCHDFATRWIEMLDGSIVLDSAAA